MYSVQWPRKAAFTMVLGSVLAACATGPSARPPSGGTAHPEAEPLLKAQTQALLDAIASGDVKVWERYIDPQILYIDEAGTVETKASLIAQLKPLPAGISGNIVIGRYEVRRFGDTAVVLHVDEESENYFGHELHAQYMSIMTWRLGADGWKMIGAQTYASLQDPPAIALPADQLDDYAGTYQLSDAISYVIRRNGDQLTGQRTGRDPQVLRVEARDVLFVPGQPRSRKIFLRDARGQVTRFADRREARDVVWTRR
jgi:hypothetical protein